MTCSDIVKPVVVSYAVIFNSSLCWVAQNCSQMVSLKLHGVKSVRKNTICKNNNNNCPINRLIKKLSLISNSNTYKQGKHPD